MSMSANKLRLGPLPRSENVKLTIALPATLKEALDHYAAVHSQVYGEHVDTAALIPHMLGALSRVTVDSRPYVRLPPCRVLRSKRGRLRKPSLLCPENAPTFDAGCVLPCWP